MIFFHKRNKYLFKQVNRKFLQSVEINLTQSAHQIKLIFESVMVEIHTIPQVNIFNFSAVIVDVVEGNSRQFLVAYKMRKENFKNFEQTLKAFLSSPLSFRI